MSGFPKRYVMPNGSVYSVMLENVRDDYAATVAQFDDLTEAQKIGQVEAFDQEQAESWMGDQWLGSEVISRGKATGEVCAETLEKWLAFGLVQAAERWASEYEAKP